MKSRKHSHIITRLQGVVRSSPNAIAISDSKKTYTYEELWRVSSQLAIILQDQYQLLPEERTAIYMQRSADMLVVMIAIFMARGTYIPLDSHLPKKRIDYILDDAHCQLVLTDDSTYRELKPTDSTCVVDVTQLIQAAENHDLTLPQIKPSDAAYIIYTSGTTGQPKGVIVSHENVNYYTKNVAKYIGINNQHIVDFSTSPGFDLSVTTTIVSLALGAHVAVFDDDSKNLASYLDHLKKRKVSTIKLTPSYFELLLDYLPELNLHSVVLGGEKCHHALFQRINLASVVIYDEYGPTEATVGATLAKIYPQGDTTVGLPYDGCKILIVDEHLKELPVGSKGEVIISGDGVAEGYLHKDRLTATKFIDISPYGRCYRTGDLGELTNSGKLIYHGRIDDQVKVNGFRIELSEIENYLLNHKEINQVSVNVSGQHLLVAYYVADEVLNSEQLTQYASQYLPEYMVPAKFVHLSHMPLTNNGKVDKDALNTLTTMERVDAIQLPESSEQEALVKLYSSFLCIPSNLISVNDTLMNLGANSITAIRIHHALATDYSIQITSRQLQKTTVRMLAKQIRKHKHNRKSNSISEWTVRNSRYPLSDTQKSLWFELSMSNQLSIYNLPVVYQLDDCVDLARLQFAIKKVIAENDSLLSIVKEDDDSQLRAYCNPEKVSSIIVQDSEFSDMHQWSSELKLWCQVPFDLSNEIPVKVRIDKVGKHYYLAVCIHHIIFDGWSEILLIDAITQYYQNHRHINSFVQYPVLQKSLSDMKRSSLSDDQVFWSKYLDDYQTLDMPHDRKRTQQFDYQGATETLSFDATTSHQLRQFAKKHSVSLYSVMLSAYTLLLRIYSNQSDIVIGNTFANRDALHANGVIGYLVNTLPVRIQVEVEDTILEFVKKVQSSVDQVMQYQHMSFHDVLKTTEDDVNLSFHPIYQVVFELAVTHSSLASPFVRKCPQQIGNALYDLNLIVDDSSEEIKVDAIYATSLFDKQTIVMQFETYQQIIKELLDKPVNDSIRSINYLDSQTYETIVLKWNDTYQDYPLTKTLAELFECVVDQYPSKVAVVTESAALTYQSLNEKVNQLTRYLIDTYMIKQDELVVIMMDRGIEFLITMLSVFKAGIAYIPIDPAMPEDRIISIIDDSAPKLVITQDEYQSVTRDIVETRCYDLLPLSQYSKENLKLIVHPNALAYIIFTSGSTGKPKGAMVEYQGMINHLYNKITDLQITDIDIVAQTASQSFDVSVWQFITALLVGGTTVVFEGTDAWEPNGLLKLMDRFKVTIFQTVPSHMHAILPVIEQSVIQAKKLQYLRWLIINGEPLASDLCLDWFAIHKDIPIINMYGPTECSDDVTHYKIYADTIEQGSYIMPIHGTLGNTQIYILDDYLSPVPVGAVGELCIGGSGVGRGYLKRESLTNEKFVDNVFSSVQLDQQSVSKKLYRTGDLVKYHLCGKIEYLNRKDFQVKIRGFRIELGEIEKALLLHEDISQVVVLADSAGSSKYLVAYYISENQLPHDEIVSFLSQHLPEYMIPTVFICMEEFPLTLSGKLNRKLLPKPKKITDDSILEPVTDLEKAACQIWASSLNMSDGSIGMHSDFFHLGGDSIICIQIAHKMQHQLHLNVTVKDIFQYRTVEQVLLNSQSISIELDRSMQERPSGKVLLLPVQAWFVQLSLANPRHYNQAFLIKVPPLDIEVLQPAVNQLIHHHDAFRLRYQHNQLFYTDKPENIVVKQISFENLSDDFLTEVQSSFRLDSGPIVSITYIDGYPDDSARIHFACHHMVIDTVSWRIICEHLYDLYHSKSLSVKTSSYQSFSEALYSSSRECTNEKVYWEKVLQDFAPLPFDNLTPTVKKITLSQEYTDDLLNDCHKPYDTQINDILLSALALSLTEYTGSKYHHITLEGHGREAIADGLDVAQTVGWFTTMYPIRLESHSSLESTVVAIKNMLRAIPNRGINFGVLYGYQNKDFPLPNISFNYLGQFDQDEKLSDSWQITNEDPGAVSDIKNGIAYDMEIVSWVLNKQLHVRIHSRGNQHNNSELLNLFKSVLINIIADLTKCKQTFLTASDTDFLISQATLDHLQEEYSLSEVICANSLQQGFVAKALKQDDPDDAYLVQVYWDYHTDIDINSLIKAWGLLQHKYSVLRTHFDWNDEIVQVVHQQCNLPLEFIDSTNLSEAEINAFLLTLRSEDRKLQFDLSRAPLFRLKLIKCHQSHYHLLFSCHHAILDGWSIELLIHEVHIIYLKLLNSPDWLTKQDLLYSRTQNAIAKLSKEHEKFWDNHCQVNDPGLLNGLLCKQAINHDVSLANLRQIGKVESRTIVIDSTDYQLLLKYCRTNGITVNVFCQYIWHKLLFIYGGGSQTTVGMTVSGRELPIKGIEKSIGLYINTLPIVMDHNDCDSIKDELYTLQLSILEAQQHSAASLAKILKNNQCHFDSLFIFENYPLIHDEQLDVLHVGKREYAEKIDYPLGMLVYEKDASVTLTLQFADEIIDESIISFIMHSAKKCMLSIINQECTEASKLVSLCVDKPYSNTNFQLQDSNNSSEKHTLLSIYYDIVEKYSDNVAIFSQNRSYTYSEFNLISSNLAAYLSQTYTINHGDHVIISLDRGVDSLIAIFAVLKLGAAFVPVDPNTPDKRFQYILEDTNPPVLITHAKYETKFHKMISPNKCHIINGFICGDNDFTHTDSHSANDVAYVIYTSGTTGKPKGVQVAHLSVVDLHCALTDLYAMDKGSGDENILLFANTVFDASIEQIMLALLNGHTLTVISDTMLNNPAKLFNYLSDQKVTHIHCPPLMIKHYDFAKIKSLKRLISGGDVLTKDIIDYVASSNANLILYNEYGPTETTVTAVVKKVSESSTAIGTPLKHIQAYVLNETMQPLPIGAIGELYLSGSCVAKGYLNSPDLTASAFINDPFSKQKIMYRTGDLVWVDSSGELHFSGRKDDQVKVRGYRIELSAITNVLLDHDAITTCVTITKNYQDNEQIIVYYVSKAELSVEVLSELITSTLPSYMLPHHFIALEKMPLNLSGKVDRKRLPDPYREQSVAVDYDSELEKQVCLLWAEALGINSEYVSPCVDFFRLGGDSITAIQISNHMRRQLNIHVGISDIFRHRTVRQLLGKQAIFQREFIQEQGLLTGHLGLLPIQNWFFNQQLDNAGHFNQAFMVRVPELNPSKVRASLTQLVKRHDMLRCRYADGKAHYTTDESYLFSHISYNQLNQQYLSAIQENFDIKLGPVLSVCYIDNCSDNSARLFFACHHLVIDSVSWHIIVNDLHALYHAVDLGSKTTSFRQWVCELNNYGVRSELQKDYWINVIGDCSYDYPLCSKNHSAKDSLSVEFTDQLLGNSHDAYSTKINDLLLSALAICCNRVFGRKVNHITVEGHGREPISENVDLSDTVGWFTTMYPVRLEYYDDIAKLIKVTKEMLRDVPDNGIGYGAIYGYTETQLPVISFNYLGQLDQKTAAENSWIIVDEDVGETLCHPIDYFAISFDAWVLDGRLTVSVSARCEKDITEKLASEFITTLGEVVSHTCQVTHTVITPSDVDYIISEDKLYQLQSNVRIKQVLNVNALQKGMIAHALLRSNVDDAYLVQMHWGYSRPIDVVKFEDAWNQVTADFDTLRVFFEIGEQPLQIIQAEVKTNFHYFDFSQQNKNDRQASLLKYFNHDRLHPFDVTNGPLFRVALFKLSEHNYHVLLTNHHAILDGASIPILLNRLHAHYLGSHAGPPIIQDAYIEVQRYLQSQQGSHVDFWQTYISNKGDDIDLSSLYRPSVIKSEVKIQSYAQIQQPTVKSLLINEKITSKLQSSLQLNAATINTFIQYCWHKILSIYSCSRSTCIGTVVMGRHLPVDGIDEVVGMMINTVPVIMQHQDFSNPLSSVIASLQKEIATLTDFSHCDISAVSRLHDLSYDSIYIYDQELENRSMFNDEMSMGEIESIEKLDHPLVLSVRKSATGLKLTLQYAGELFSDNVALRLLSHIQVLVQLFCEKQLNTVADIQLGSLSDQPYLSATPSHKTLTEQPVITYFHEICKKFPDKTAIKYLDVRITYKELQSQVDIVAANLRKVHGIQAQDKVGVILERNELLLVTILAMYQIQAIYVPIDAEYPVGRVNYIVSDAALKAVILSQRYSSLIDAIEHSTTIFNESLLDSTYAEQNTRSESYQDNCDAYIIYTSGSTGQPKGVLIKQDSVVNLIHDLNLLYQLKPGDDETILLFANIVFDASVEQMLLGLLNGFSVLVVNLDQIRDPDEMTTYLSSNNVTHVHLPPVMLQRYNFSACTQLRRLISGGDILSSAVVKNLHDLYPDLQIVNEYGPTETTVTSIVNSKVTAADTSIGKPLSSISACILDDANNFVPCGALGHLYIGGPCVAKGYINQQALTDKAFVSLPYVSSQRYYRTGDLAWLDEEGNFHFVSRSDQQVKIRGYRIEIGEIECVLMKHPAVKDAAVNYYSDIQMLCAYYVSANEIDANALAIHMSHFLPDYMLPVMYIRIDSVPLTKGGKVKKNALPAPIVEQSGVNIQLSEKESLVCHIWADVLGLSREKVGLDSDFFYLGGDSISAMRLVSRLREELAMHVKSSHILEYRTIRLLLSHAAYEQKEKKPVEQYPLGASPLVPVQNWFFNQKFVSRHHFNQAFFVRTKPLKCQQLQVAIDKLIQYHDCFRLRFSNNEMHYAQSAVDIKVQHLLPEETTPEKLTQLQSNFSLENGFMFAIAYIDNLSNLGPCIYVACHHLLIDVVSWQIIVDDLFRLYHNQNLPQKTHSYKQWAQQISQLIPDQHSIDYWHSLSMNTCKSLPYLDTSSSIEFSISKVLTESLLGDALSRYHMKVDELLLSAFAIALTDVFGTHNYAVTMEGHGREADFCDMDLSRTVGWFTSMYPVHISSEGDIANTIIATKDNFRNAKSNSIAYGVLVGYQNLPPICFNYLGKLDQDQSSDWQIMNDSLAMHVCHKNKSSFKLVVNCWIQKGELVVSLESHLAKNHTKLLSRCFERSITSVIEHICSLKRNYLTCNDVNYIADISFLHELQEKSQVDYVLLASSLQQGFIANFIKYPEDNAYHNQMCWSYYTSINMSMFREAWQRVQTNFSVLRMRFSWQHSIVQIVDHDVSLNWKQYDVSSMSQDEQKAMIFDLKNADRKNHYDLTKSGLFRVYFIKLSDERFYTIFSFHHAILDGWSTSVLLNYLHETYLALVSNSYTDPQLVDAYINVQKFTQQSAPEASDLLEQSLLLDTTMNFTSLLTDKARLAGVVVDQYQLIKDCMRAKTQIVGHDYHSIVSYCQRQGVTMNALMQYAWHVVLHYYCHTDNTVLGVVMSGRQLPIADIDKVVGLLIKTLPVVCTHSEGLISEHIKKLQLQIAQYQSISNVNLADLSKDSSRLFHCLFTFENYPDQTTDLEDILRIHFDEGAEKSDYPLALVIDVQDETVNIALDYASEIFSGPMMHVMLDTYALLLKQIVNNDQLHFEKLQLIDNIKIEEAPATANDERSFVAVFNSTVQKYPNKVAVRDQKIALTYYELDQLSTQLAFYILDQNRLLSSQPIVAILMAPSAYMLVSIIAILKAGAAYLPLNATSSYELVEFILHDADVSLLLTDNNVNQSVPTIQLDNDFFQDLPSLGERNLNIHYAPDNLAYVIYTSGTTGKPKGVMIEHRHLCHYIANANKHLKIDDNAIVDFSSNVAFDLTITTTVVPLSLGAEVIVYQESLLDVPSYVTYLIANGISVVKMTPSYFECIIDRLQDTGIKTVVVGGEKFKHHILNKLNYDTHKFTIVDEYGPTEATVGASFSIIYPDTNVSIGRPYDNTSMKVINQYGQLLAPGMLGECAITGSGVARGYLGKKELTEESFVKLTAIDSTRLCYLTGDLISQRIDGQFDYHGRIDNQMKVRGYRIESDAISTVIMSSLPVQQVEVIVHNDQLIAYYIALEDVDEQAMQQVILQVMPSYMVPDCWQRIDRFPLTHNGKLDTKALLKNIITKDTNFVKPTTESQKILIESLALILSRAASSISMSDSFFNIGGNSLAAVKLVNVLNKSYSCKLSINDVYTSMNLSQLAEKLYEPSAGFVPIYPLNNHSDSPAMFMIHPGAGGCESYHSLAKILSGHYDCFGIDAHNIHHQEKIEDIDMLANHYLSLLPETAFFADQIILLGWSLGGKIALAMAGLLEERYEGRIFCILLDTILNDNNLLELRNAISITAMEDSFSKQAAKLGLSADYTSKILNNMPLDRKLLSQPIHRKVQSTEVILFKAQVCDDDEGDAASRQLYQYGLSLKSNNIERVVTKPFKIVKLDVSHSLILNEEKLIASEICNFINHNEKVLV